MEITEVGFKFRHDLVRDVILDICFRAGVAASKEVPLGFLSDNSSGLKLADILVHNWENGLSTCFDVTGVSPFSGGSGCSFTPGHAIASAVNRKMNKYLDKCTSHGYCFSVLAFTILGELGDDMVVFLKRLKNCLTNYDDVNSKVGGYLFHRVGLAIQKGVGAQFVARLPSIHIQNDDI